MRKETLPLPGSKGFTLLELLIVVILIGILATIAIPGYGRTMERAKVREAEGALNLIYQAQRVYKLDHGTYATLDQLVNGRYLPDPNPNENWVFCTVGTPRATDFTAQALRKSGGWKGNCIKITETGKRCRRGYTSPLSEDDDCGTDCVALTNDRCP